MTNCLLAAIVFILLIMFLPSVLIFIVSLAVSCGVVILIMHYLPEPKQACKGTSHAQWLASVRAEELMRLGHN